MSLLDETYVVLPPQWGSSSIGQNHVIDIVVCLSTRFNQPINVVRRFVEVDRNAVWTCSEVR
jgi:hypothetical protein